MFNDVRRLCSVAGAVALAVLLFGSAAFTTFAQPASPVRFVQAEDGILYIVTDAKAWRFTPRPIDDDQLAKIVTSPGIADGALPTPPRMIPEDPGILVTADGRYLLTAGYEPSFLVPDQIADADLAALTLGEPLLDGTIPRELWTDTLTPSATPPATGIAAAPTRTGQASLPAAPTSTAGTPKEASTNGSPAPGAAQIITCRLTGVHQGQAILQCDDGAAYTLPGPDQLPGLDQSGKATQIFRETGGNVSQGEFLPVTVDDAGNLVWVDAQGRDCVLHETQDGDDAQINCTH